MKRACLCKNTNKHYVSDVLVQSDNNKIIVFRKRNIIITLVILLSVRLSFAQDYFDALRYSQTEYGGTARSMAMGSAFGALGADFISASINPAGLGLYRSSEFSFSPVLNYNKTLSYYINNTEPEDKYKFQLNNIGYAGTFNTGAETGVLSVTFGMGFNKIKDFNSKKLIKTNSAKTSLLDFFTRNIYDNNIDPLYEGLAKKTNLVFIDNDMEVLEGYYRNDFSNYTAYDVYNDNNEYVGYKYVFDSIYTHSQRKLSESTGYINEFLLSMAGNINNKLFLGASFGFDFLSHIERTFFTEYDDINDGDTEYPGKSDYINRYSFSTYSNTNGVGVNFKLGMIYRPFKPLRLGVSIHTPTFYTISWEGTNSAESYFDQNVDLYEYDSPTEFKYKETNNHWKDNAQSYYQYQLRTPFRTNFSAAFSISNFALLSADYEMINYSSAKFDDMSSDPWDYSDTNSDIYNVLNSSNNIRLGAEIRLTPSFSLRGGYNINGNPWKGSYKTPDGSTFDILNANDTSSSYSAGFGYRENNFFIDFAFRLGQYNYSYKVHETYYIDPAVGDAISKIKEQNQQATITLGFRF